MTRNILGIDIQSLTAIDLDARIIRSEQIELSLERRAMVDDAALRARLIVRKAKARAQAIEAAAARRAGLAGKRAAERAVDEAVARSLRWLVDAKAYEDKLFASLSAQLCEWAEQAVCKVAHAQDAADLIAGHIGARLAESAHLTDWELRLAPPMMEEVARRLNGAPVRCIADDRLAGTEALLQSGALILHVDIARHQEQLVTAMREVMRHARIEPASAGTGGGVASNAVGPDAVSPGSAITNDSAGDSVLPGADEETA